MTDVTEPSLPDPNRDEAADAPDPARPDPLAFQQASMRILVFRFQGKRRLVASRLMVGHDFVAELKEHLPRIARLYPQRRVSAVEVVSYQHGRYYADPWPAALRWIDRFAPELLPSRDDASADEAFTPESAPP